MAAISPENLAQRIVDAGLLDAKQIESVWAELGTREIKPDDLTSLLLRKELLTNYQLERLFKGEKGGYFYGDCKVLYLVGTGTFARVYRAVNMATGRIVAVKALRKRFREDRQMTENFVREGKIGMQLRHPNVVPIYDVDSLPSPYLVMEFIEGQNLRDFVKVRKKLGPVDAMKLAVDILAGLAYASEKGMTHRDLKMSNVLVTSRGVAKLVDFGLAGLQGTRREEEGGAPRTLDYAGLERASGVPNNDPRSDLYFAGVILYHMLAGVSPLGEARDRTSRMSIGRFQNIKPVTVHEANLPNRLVAFVMRSLELNPDKRHSTAQEMYDDARRLLTRLQAGDTSEPDPSETASRPGPRKLASEEEGYGRTVMLVESKTELQDLLRDRLKKHGYRVLVFSDPKRALHRFQDGNDRPADCVLISTQELGQAGLDAFNEFGSLDGTKELPAILLVDNRQDDIIRRAQLNEHRMMLSMPLKVKELRNVLLKLLRPEASQV